MLLPTIEPYFLRLQIIFFDVSQLLTFDKEKFIIIQYTYNLNL